MQQQLIASVNKKAKTKHNEQIYFNGSTNSTQNNNTNGTIAINTATASLLTGVSNQQKYQNANLNNINNKFRNIKTTIASPIMSTKIINSNPNNVINRNNITQRPQIGTAPNTIKLSNSFSNRNKIDDIKQQLLLKKDDTDHEAASEHIIEDDQMNNDEGVNHDVNDHDDDKTEDKNSSNFFMNKKKIFNLTNFKSLKTMKQ